MSSRYTGGTVEKVLRKGGSIAKICTTGVIPLIDNNSAFIELRKSYKATPTSSLLVTNLTIADLILLFQLIHQVKNDINGGLRKVFKSMHPIDDTRKLALILKPF